MATFKADVTIPLGHRCMGILPTKSRAISDPLEARGWVLWGDGLPIVLVTVDWCEIRNGAYDRWRDVLAAAAETVPSRVLVSSNHQHDAPVVDLDAEKLLGDVGLGGELCDVAFHETCVQRVAQALRRGLREAGPVTHIGIGQAEVYEIASNRRVVDKDGRVTFSRSSASGGNAFFAAAPEGTIDRQLRTLSFWNGDAPVAALSSYAVHPMSYYGQGQVSADFVGLARRRRQFDTPETLQVYASGCSGDTTAGKYNDGSPANRAILADRLYQAMRAAWADTRKFPLCQVRWQQVDLRLDFRQGETYTDAVLRRTLADEQADTRDRILAAMSLSSLQRVNRDQPIQMPCLDLGPVQLVLLPGETFVGYQLAAQQLRPDSTVMCLGYGECWPGYIPTAAAERDGFDDVWWWCDRGAEPHLMQALRQVLRKPE